jgi:hypothetical protein
MPTDSSQFLWGAQAIADFIERKRRDAYHLLENNLIPAKKVGSQWVAHRDTLRAHLSGASDDEKAA